LRVACLGVGQVFTDEVDRMLDFGSVTLLLLFYYDGDTHYMSSGRDV
jgi:hypothetical protein